MRQWIPDVELSGFEQTVIPLSDEPTYAMEPEGSLVATLVRRNLPTSSRAVLYVHGWSDYFFQRHLADEMAALGYDFYALDLRRYGRSLRPKQLAGYVADLRDYFVELDQAVEILRLVGHDDIVLMAHSTGGLIGSLYANDRPGTFSAVVLNAPWLELQGNALLRPVTQTVLTPARVLAPTSALPGIDTGLYRRMISATQEGEWHYNLDLKGDPSFRVRVGWLAAIMDGHAEVAAGLKIDCPVLVAVSERSDFNRNWDDGLRLADIVLDVDRIAERAHQLGNVVVIVRVGDALHDLVLSRDPVRRVVFNEFARFLAGYASPSSATPSV